MGGFTVHPVAMSTLHVSADTPISQLTVGELIDVLTSHGIASSAQQPKATAKRYVYGIAGLAGLLNCSHPTAHRLKASGKIPFTQAGRKLVFDEQAVLSALSKSKK